MSLRRRMFACGALGFTLGLLGCGGSVQATGAVMAPRVATESALALAFAGDVRISSRPTGMLDASATGPIADALSGSDVTLLTLETAITSSDSRAVAGLRAAGVDAVSLAHDHSLDHGRVGLTATLAAAKAGGLPVFGAGEDATAAYEPWRTTVRGTRIAVFGLNQVEDPTDDWAARDDRSGIAQALDQKRSLAAVSAARKTSDLVIVMPHWGFERDDCPNVAQRDFAAELSEAGADVIVGSHAQVLQGRGYLGRTYVAFGMGAFTSDGAGVSGGSGSTRHTGVLKLTVRGREVVTDELVPAMASATGAPVAISAEAAHHEQKRLDGLRPCAYLNQDLSPALSDR